MAKTIILNLSPQIIADFESCFDTKQKERAYLFKQSTEKINQNTGDVFIKRHITFAILEDGKKTTQKSTLDEVNFEQTELVSNPNWNTKDIGGTLEPYQYLIGDTFWKKINNWAKLLHIINSKFNNSVIDDAEKALSQLKSDGKIPETQIKLKEEQLEKSKEEFNKNKSEECLEVYLHSLFAGVIIEKLQSSEKQMMDKEFAELNKPEEKKKPEYIPEIVN